MISESAIAAIKKRLDIVEIVGESVKLRRSGRSFRGICPFHADSDPSFYVHPDRQFYYCFGCQARGDIIRFVQQMEGRSFAEAVAYLAERAGVEIEETRDPAARKRQQRKRKEKKGYFELMEEAVRFYSHRLGKSEGEGARKELETRAVSAETAKHFRLGYAPDSWDALITYMNSRGYTGNDLEKAGLAMMRKSGRGFYDRFRNRLLFPVMDERGRAAGFSGRMLGDDDEKGAKYINSPETRFFRKGHVIFGLSSAKGEIRKSGEAILVEGNFDLVSLHSAGFRNVVSPLGTALTPEQAHLIRRFTEKVVILFDGDDAGWKAAKRALIPLTEAGLEVWVCRLPEGEDPDSVLRSEGAGYIQDLLDKRQDMIESIIQEASSGPSLSPSQISRAVASLAPYVRAVKDRLARDLYIKKIGREFAIEEREIRSAFMTLSPGRTQNTQTRPEASSGSRAAGSELRTRTEQEIVGILLDCPDLLKDMEHTEIAGYFSTGPYRDVLDRMVKNLLENAEADPLALVEGLGDENAEKFISGRLMQAEFATEDAARKVLTEAIGTLKTRCCLSERKQLLNRRISEAEKKGDDDELERLLQEKIKLARSLSAETAGESGTDSGREQV